MIFSLCDGVFVVVMNSVMVCVWNQRWEIASGKGRLACINTGEAAPLSPSGRSNDLARWLTAIAAGKLFRCLAKTADSYHFQYVTACSATAPAQADTTLLLNTPYSYLHTARAILGVRQSVS